VIERKKGKRKKGDERKQKTTEPEGLKKKKMKH